MTNWWKRLTAFLRRRRAATNLRKTTSRRFDVAEDELRQTRAAVIDAPVRLRALETRLLAFVEAAGEDWESYQTAMIERLIADKREFEAGLQEFRDAQSEALDEARRQIDDLREHERRYERELEHLRAMCQIYQDQIATLESANRSHLQRYDAETAIQVGRESMATPSLPINRNEI